MADEKSVMDFSSERGGAAQGMSVKRMTEVAESLTPRQLK
jgi:hypothetical protein